MAEIKLSNEESEQYFHSALCNVGGTLRSLGLILDYSDKEYKSSRENLAKKLIKEDDVICQEDVWMQMLRDGKKLTLVDVENEGEMTRSFTLADVHERVNKMPQEHLIDFIQENDDATTAAVLLIQVAYDDQLFAI